MRYLIDFSTLGKLLILIQVYNKVRYWNIFDGVFEVPIEAVQTQTFHMTKLFPLALLLALILHSQQCPIDSQSIPRQLICTSNIACGFTSGGQSSILVQNCNKKWYYGNTSAPIVQLSSASSDKFISNNQLALGMKLKVSIAMINYNNQEFYVYPLGSNKYNKKLISKCPIKDYEIVELGGGSVMTLQICSNKVTTAVLDPDLKMLDKSQLTLIDNNLEKIECFNNSVLCSIGTLNGKILIYNTSSNTIVNTIDTSSNSSVTLLKSTEINGTNQHKVYVTYADGLLQEYRLSSLGSARFMRDSQYFRGQSIHQLGNYPNSDYLIVSDKRGNLSQIDLSTGILLSNIAVLQYLIDKSSPAISLLLNNQTSYYIYNRLNNFFYLAGIYPDNTKNHVVLKCYSLFFYNNSFHECQPCSSTCATCDPVTGSCSQCIGEHFNSNGECKSCYYDSKGLTHHFDECFSKNEKLMMETSEAVVTFLSTVVSNFAVFLNICGLLFLFLKLINNWNIICLYFFVEIQQPFFLQNVLKNLFTTFSSSVLKTIGINFRPSFGTANRAISSKFELVEVNTDFLLMNSEQIILFFYSVILISTVYKIVNFMLAKVKISIFEQNSAISIIEEFIGCFTVSLLPFYYVIFRPYYTSRWEKINSSVHLLFVGLTIIIPFLFFIFDHEYKIIRTNKVQSNDENHIAEMVNLGLTKRIKVWRQDDCKQRFFYGLLSVVTALLACNPNVKIFIFGVGFIHILYFINAWFVKKMKVNNIIQKLSFLTYHFLFSSMHFISNETIKFKISLVLVSLIVMITVHELVITCYLKIYFVCMLVKGKWQKEEKIRLFFEENQKKMKQKNREHPIALPLVPAKKEKNEEKEPMFKFKKLQVKLVRVNQKQVEKKEEEKTPQKHKKKEAKSAKKVEQKQTWIKEIDENSHSSLEKRGMKAERRKLDDWYYGD